MRTHTASIVLGACLLASTAHADDGKPVSLVVGSALGSESQRSTDGSLFSEVKDASMSLAQLHVGARLLDGWIEPAIDLELGQGSGTRSYAGFLALRVHLVPWLRVHPTLLGGYGAVVDHGTAAMDDQTGARAAAFGGVGLEVRIDSHWTATAELRLMLVGGEDFHEHNPGTVAYYAAHGVLADGSAQLGATYRF